MNILEKIFLYIYLEIYLYVDPIFVQIDQAKIY